jgi:orotate phosphoribosyltransferase
MNESEALEALKQTEAVLSGHFQLTSGRHSASYVQCARVLEDPALTTRFAEAIVERLPDGEIDLVASPAVGGIVIGFAVAQALGVKFIFSERVNGVMQFRRGFGVPLGARVLVVEDVVTTGGSVAEVIELVRVAGGVAVAVASIIDRGGPKKFAIPLHALLRLEVESWEPETCVLCADGVEIYAPGSRRISE